MKHDHLCEAARLIGPTRECGCARRAYYDDPVPAEDRPIYPAEVPHE